jgi:sugar-specific transcriptional regulator TrmB
VTETGIFIAHTAISVNREFFAKAKRLVTEDEDVQTLTHLGLTTSQAKVYLALLELEKATGKTISKHSKVARQEAYRILAELQEKGLVERIIAMPTEFKPIPIKDCIYILIGRKKNEISKTQKEAITLLQKLKEESSHALQEEEPQFILVPEKEAIRRVRRNIENTRTSLDVITTLNRFKLGLFNFDEVDKKALERGVKFRLIINKPDDENSLTEIVKAVTENPLFEIRYINTPPLAAIAIYDKKEVIIAISATAAINEVPILMSNNPSLLAIAQNYFETMWLTAMEINFKIPRKPKK